MRISRGLLVTDSREINDKIAARKKPISMKRDIPTHRPRPDLINNALVTKRVLHTRPIIVITVVTGRIHIRVLSGNRGIAPIIGADKHTVKMLRQKSLRSIL